MSDSWKALQDLRKPPKLLLHKLHRKDKGGGLQPLLCEAMLNVFCPASSEPKATTEGAPGLHDVSIRIEDRHIIIAPDEGAATDLTLLFAEVRLGQDVQSGFPLIVVAGTEGGTIWLLLVEGNEVAGKRALAMMGEAGAIRSDFSKGFTLHPRPLGSGSNAAVYKVNVKCPAGEGVEDLVAKIGFTQNEDQDRRSQQQEAIPRDVRLEVEMLSMVQRHPNIVGFHGLFRYVERVEDAEADQPQHVTRWILTLQFCQQGDLFSIVSKAVLSEAKTREIASGLLNALAHVHKLGIVHRDVKPENMLITGDGRPLLADFGISCHISDYQQMQRRCGSPSYAAPEILGGKAYGTKVDCFSTGSLTFFIVSGKLPFDGPNIASMLRRTERCQVDFDVSPIFRTVSEPCKAFILSLLVRSPDERPTAEVALQSEWVQGVAARAPERRRKSNTAAPNDSQRVAALALAGVNLTDQPRPPSNEEPAPIPMRATSGAPARSQASGSDASPNMAGSPRPPPTRRDRLGSLTGPAAAAAPAPATRPSPARRFFNLPKVFKRAKKEGDSFHRDDDENEVLPSVADSDVRSIGSGSDDSDEESRGSRQSFENGRGGDAAARAEGSGSRNTRSSLGRRFRRIVSPRGPTPGAASSSSAGPAQAPNATGSTSTSIFGSSRSTSNARASNSPSPPTPVRTGNRSKTVDPGAVRLASARSSVANAAAAAAAASAASRNNSNSSSGHQPQPPARSAQRTSTTDSSSSRSYAARLGSLAQQMASRVGMSRHDNPGGESPEAEQDEDRDDDFKASPSHHAAPQYPVPPAAPPPMKGPRRQPPTGGRRVSMA